MLGKKLKQARLCTVLIFTTSFSLCVKLHAAPDRASLANTYIPKFEKILKENIASFWYSKSLDRRNGGYTINFGPDQDDRQPGADGVVVQPTGEGRLWW
jgi:hypothetical protein